MDHRLETTRQCPTRTDGADSLIAHEIPPGTCQERQRRHYHKCYTCAHRNAAAVNGQTDSPPKPLLERIPRARRAPLT